MKGIDRLFVWSILGIFVFFSQYTSADDLLPSLRTDTQHASDAENISAKASPSKRVPGRARWISGVVLTTSGGLLFVTGLVGIILAEPFATEDPVIGSNNIPLPYQPDSQVEELFSATLLGSSVLYLVPGIILWISGWKKMKKSKQRSVTFALPSPVMDPNRSTFMLKMAVTY